MLNYHAQILELFVNHFLAGIGPEKRLNVLNAILRENDCEELPYICPETGLPTRTAEAYYKALVALIETAG